MIIILVGMPGCGKTSIGKKLAHKLQSNFIDTDEYLEHKFNTSVSNIFSRKGELFFRKVESLAIKLILRKFILLQENLVISLGGGAFLSKFNKKICLDSGYVIWLNLDANIIYSRIKNNTNRPLLKNQDKQYLINMFNLRKDHYNEAHCRFNINSQDSKSFIVSKIMSYLSKEQII